MKRLFGYILIGAGVLIVGLAGQCVFEGINFFHSAGLAGETEPVAIMLPMLAMAAPLLAGMGMIVGGWVLVQRAK